MIAERVVAVRERIARAAARVGRPAADVTLIAVSKRFPPEAVRACFEAGVREFGENKVQEAEGKIATLQDLRNMGARFHLIGHLQDNKARKAAALFDVVQSVDSAERGLRLARVAEELGRVLPVLVQVDLAGEETKHGLRPENVPSALEALVRAPSLRVDGLMALPPFFEDPERSRPFFQRLRHLSEELRSKGLLPGAELSMGMSHDLEPAVEEGATMVRVGTAIFGSRSETAV